MGQEGRLRWLGTLAHVWPRHPGLGCQLCTPLPGALAPPVSPSPLSTAAAAILHPQGSVSTLGVGVGHPGLGHLFSTWKGLPFKVLRC